MSRVGRSTHDTRVADPHARGMKDPARPADHLGNFPFAWTPMPALPRIDPKLDRRTWRDRRGRRGDDLRTVFAWLEGAEPTVWWDPATIARSLGAPRRRVQGAVDALVAEFAVERVVDSGHRCYRLICW